MSSSIETEQVKLRLTENEDVLDQLKRNGRYGKNPQSKKFELWIQYDGKTFRFRQGEVLIVGRSVANALKRDSLVIVGAHIDGAQIPAVEEIGHYDVTQGVTENTRIAATTCGVCYLEFETLPALMHHMKQHEKDHPELFVTAEEAEAKDERPIVVNPETGRKERGSLPMVDVR